MKKVVDINYLRRPELEEYLSQSRNNYVVLSDMASMEIYKSSDLNNVANSIRILSRYPKQVIVLKVTRDIVSLSIKPIDLPEALIDHDETNGFSEFCNHVWAALSGNEYLSRQVLMRGSWASQYLNDLIKSNQFLIEGIRGFIKSYKPDHIKKIRTSVKLTTDILDIITKNIMYITALLCQKHPDVYSLPEFNWLDNSYIFRNTVSAYFLSLRWIKDGGLDQVGDEKFRNDFVDMSYVTYATYFDGLLTFDEKLIEMYQITLDYLRYFRNPEQIASVDQPEAAG